MHDRLGSRSVCLCAGYPCHIQFIHRSCWIHPDPSVKNKQPVLQKSRKILFNIILYSELGVFGYEQKMELLCQNLYIMNADRQ